MRRKAIGAERTKTTTKSDSNKQNWTDTHVNCWVSSRLFSWPWPSRDSLWFSTAMESTLWSNLDSVQTANSATTLGIESLSTRLEGEMKSLRRVTLSHMIQGLNITAESNNELRYKDILENIMKLSDSEVASMIRHLSHQRRLQVPLFRLFVVREMFLS